MDAQRGPVLEENEDFASARASAYRIQVRTICRTGPDPEEGIGQALVERRTRRPRAKPLKMRSLAINGGVLRGSS